MSEKELERQRHEEMLRREQERIVERARAQAEARAQATAQARADEARARAGFKQNVTRPRAWLQVGIRIRCFCILACSVFLGILGADFGIFLLLLPISSV